MFCSGWECRSFYPNFNLDVSQIMASTKKKEVDFHKYIFPWHIVANMMDLVKDEWVFDSLTKTDSVHVYIFIDHA